jgi:hypothetical protein
LGTENGSLHSDWSRTAGKCLLHAFTMCLQRV